MNALIELNNLTLVLNRLISVGLVNIIHVQYPGAPLETYRFPEASLRRCSSWVAEQVRSPEQFRITQTTCLNASSRAASKTRDGQETSDDELRTEG